MANDGKFTTINSTLFTNQNAEQLPDWMANINTNTKKIDALDVSFEKRGAFASNMTSNERDDRVAKPREIKAKSDKLVLEAKVQLAKILTNKYYRITDVKGTTHTANLSTDIDGIPAKFIFSFEFKDGKTCPLKTFQVMGSNDALQYPFSKAGLMECFEDIKNNRIPADKKIESVGKSYIISKEEVVRRFNGKLRDAHNKINELLKSGDIIGAGSNSFASFIDVDYLFPKLQKEACQDEVKSFEFVPNVEHVAATQKLSAKLLHIEASKFLSNIFSDYLIKSSALDNNEFLVKAVVLNKNNVQNEVDFNFNIEDNKLGSLRIAEFNNERMTIEQLMNTLNVNNELLNTYLAQNNNKNNKIYRGIVLSRKELNRKLSKLVHADTIDSIINNWAERDLINPINSSTFVSNLSVEDLLDSVDVDILSEEERNSLLEDSSRIDNNLSRIDVEDSGIREMETSVTEENMLAKANGLLSKYFSVFEPLNCSLENEVLNYNVKLFDEDTGLSTVVNLNFCYDDSNKIQASLINGKNKISLDSAREVFAQNAMLKKYLNNNSGKKHQSSIIISKQKINNILSKLSNVSSLSIDEQINSWIKNGHLHSLNENTFASKHTLEKLLSISNLIPMSEDETAEQLKKAQREKELKVSANYINDSDTRQVEDAWSAERCIAHIKDCISQFSNTNDFKILSMKKDKENVIVSANILNNSGLYDEYEIYVEKFNNKLGTIKQAHKKTIMSTNSHQNYLKYNSIEASKNKQYIFTEYSLKNKLSILGSKDSIEKSVQYLLSNNIIKSSAINGSYTSDKNIGQIISILDEKNIIDKQYTAKWEASKKEANVVTDIKKTYDNDNRKLIKKEESLSPKMIELKQKLNKIITSSYKDKLITSNKQSELNNILSCSTNEHDLEKVAKELNKYIGK